MIMYRNDINQGLDAISVIGFRAIPGLFHDVPGLYQTMQCDRFLIVLWNSDDFSMYYR